MSGRCLALWSEAMKICTKVSDEGGPFLGLRPKVIWLVYFKEDVKYVEGAKYVLPY